MGNIILAAVLLLLVGAAVRYVVKAKKSGAACIGCPVDGGCSKDSDCDSGCCCCHSDET